MDKAEVEAVYDSLKRRAERAARAVVDDDGIISEAVGHALEKVWERRDSLDRARVLSWVGAVAHNKAVDEARRRGRQASLPESTIGGREPKWQAQLRALRSPFSPTDQKAYELARQTALGLIPRKQAAALSLQLDGLTGPEIARQLGISEAAAKKRIHDARENLRAALGADLDGLLPRQRNW